MDCLIQVYPPSTHYDCPRCRSSVIWSFLCRRAGTVRAVKNVPVGSKGLTLKQHIEQTLGSGTIEQAVKLPRGEDTHEWVAVNTVFFYNALNVLYSVLDGSLCTDDRCPSMSAGPSYEYLWADGVRVKTPIKLSAPDYVNELFDWVEEQLDDPSLFPRGMGGSFPRDFLAVVKTILKRLFRVYAHIYHSHFRQIVSLELEPHLNTCFRHFILFVQEFELVEDKDMAPMKELIQKIVQQQQMSSGAESIRRDRYSHGGVIDKHPGVL